jgi:hypothetical protein
MSYVELRLIAEMYTASQRTRLGNEGRVRSASVDPMLMQPMIDLDRASEDLQARALKKTFRATVPPEIRQWQQASGGVGEHLVARLLGITGDPVIARRRYWREGGEGEAKRVLVEGAPFGRTVYNLFAYCGHGDPSRRKQRGMSQADAMALGSPEAKMLVHLLAESCMKQVRTDPETGEKRSTSRYRDVYEAAREHYERCVTCQADPGSPKIAFAVISDREMTLEEAEAVMAGDDRPVCPTCEGTGERRHTEVCVRCGPSGHPAQVGSLWSKKHQHMAALRKTGKAILKDLWKAARDAHLREAEEAKAARVHADEAVTQLGLSPETLQDLRNVAEEDSGERQEPAVRGALAEADLGQ